MVERTGDGGDDILAGTSNSDTLTGLGGDDTLTGLNASDTLFGGDGADSLDGGEGDDRLEGGAGDDSLLGGGGQDRLFGGAGDDRLDGDGPGANPGVDTIFGGAGDDTIVGGGNSDRYFGGTGDDRLLIPQAGRPFNDIVFDGGSDADGTDTDVIDLGALREAYPDLWIRFEAGGPGEEDGRILLRTSPNGQQLGRITYREVEVIEDGAPICFTPGTLIATARGEVPVDRLRAGDRIVTRDNGLQELRWTGRRSLTGVELARAPHLEPVLIRAGALGGGIPERDMRVSPNHRMLAASHRALLHFDEPEVLVAAKHLLGNPGIHQAAAMQVTYLHLLFDRHEVILANGAWTESFQPGDVSLGAIGDAQRREIHELFPDLVDRPQGYPAARRILKRHEARILDD